MTEKPVYDLSPDHIARMVMLVYGKMVDNKPFWCFVAVKPSRYDELKQLVKARKLDLRTYVDDGFGEIVVSGEGAVPPRDVIKLVAEMFKTPIRDLFRDVSVDDVVNKEIQELKKELGVE